MMRKEGERGAGQAAGLNFELWQAGKAGGCCLFTMPGEERFIFCVSMNFRSLIVSTPVLLQKLTVMQDNVSPKPSRRHFLGALAASAATIGMTSIAPLSVHAKTLSETFPTPAADDDPEAFRNRQGGQYILETLALLLVFDLARDAQGFVSRHEHQ